jgi:hypothetical protein
MFTNFFQDKPPATNTPVHNIPAAGFYQVAQNDTSMDTVANNLGVPLPNLIDANNGVKSLPPSGSYIELPGLPDSAGTPYPSVEQQQRTPHQPGIYGPGLTRPYGIGPDFGLTSNSQTPHQPGGYGPGATYNVQALAEIKNTLAAGEVPKAIPASMLTQLEATPQSMTASGWIFNSQTGTYYPPGTPSSVSGAGGSGSNPNPGMVYYSKSRGMVTYEVAKLLNKRRRRHAKEGNRLAREREAAAATAAATTQTGSTGVDQTVLALNLGSG